ncbi:hypothetical protein L6452_30630 [Arctium lappa]|uniref:Uncharacterized protein n=1 Tax=Arctium lappa TaxID=4217 RepID=A0ACB8ZHQ8_ARCLA|nr:hypothetical protein L6452_30630 [Arctium lappa]
MFLVIRLLYFFRLAEIIGRSPFSPPSDYPTLFESDLHLMVLLNIFTMHLHHSSLQRRKAGKLLDFLFVGKLKIPNYIYHQGYKSRKRFVFRFYDFFMPL